MAAICADCRTANRDGAKFCKGCGHRIRIAPPDNPAESRSDLDEDWPATQRMSMRHELDHVDDLPLSPESRTPFPPAPPRGGGWEANSDSSPSTKVAGATKTGTNRIGVWTLLTAMIVGGGWYAYSSRIINGPANIPSPAAVVLPAPAPVIAAPEPAPAELLPPPLTGLEIVQPQATPAKPAVTPPKTRKAASVRVAPPPPVVTQPVAPASPPAPEPVAPANPQTACDGLNFFARARCMAAQCAKADYKAHPQCEPVRRQQQIDEEKRNPSLLN